MPIYEYPCKGCGHEFEREQRITEKPVRTCPKCKAKKVERLISQTSFVLKGGGWYSDLYSSKPAAKSDGDSGAAKPGGEKGDKAETSAKPEEAEKAEKATKTEKTDKGDVVVDLAYLKESTATPMAKIVDGYPPAMPPQVLKDIEVESIAKFLETLK